MTQVCLLDSDRLSSLLREALSWSENVSSLMVSALNGSILAYAYRGTTPSIKAMRTQSTTMTAAYTVASEDVLVFEAQNMGAISVIAPVADHVLLAVTGPEPKQKQALQNGHDSSQEHGQVVNGVEDHTEGEGGEENGPQDEEDRDIQKIRDDLEAVSQELANVLREELAVMKRPHNVDNSVDRDSSYFTCWAQITSSCASSSISTPRAELDILVAFRSSADWDGLVTAAAAAATINFLAEMGTEKTTLVPSPHGRLGDPPKPRGRPGEEQLRSAIPPPPRYPTNSGLIATTLETANTLTIREGPEYTFQAGEGTYVLRDDLQLATPPPHPSEAPVINPNPLATSATPPTSGVKLSLVSLSPKQITPDLYRTTTATSSLLRWRTLGLNNSKETKESKELKDARELKDIKEVEKEPRISIETGSDSSNLAASQNGSNKSSTVKAFGEGNAALSPVISRDGLKRRKPKNNIIKSNSSFVSRVIPHESLAKKLQERDQRGTFAFININRAFQWLDLSSGAKQDPMTKILFTKASESSLRKL
ncbi:hypothetical protein AYO22_07296 [Fonsecaea multimorphosa]|nr:hypothetical protein AYO22_07296 [Fonsecaea multimorphosa]